MKVLLILCLTILAGALGFLLEPSLRPYLTGETPGESSDKPVGTDSSDNSITIDISSLSIDQLPKVVTIMKESHVNHQDSGITSIIKAGSSANLVGISGSTVTVNPLNTNFNIQLPISGTNLMSLVRTNPSQLTAIPSTPSTPAPQPTPVPQPAPTPEPDVPEPATAAIPSAPETPATPEPAPPEPAAPTTPPVVTAPPTPAPSAPSAPAADGTPEPDIPAATIVSIMKASIANGEINEFSADQITDWKAGNPELHEGIHYQTGNVFYTSETPFGSTTMEARALIKAGKVRRWIWPNTGVDLK